jgi:glucose-6-phosphate isomerase
VSFKIHVTGAAEEAVQKVVPTLVDDLVASGITAQNPSLWGADAESEASKRLGWVEAVSISRPLVPQIEELRATLTARGVNHIVLGGMGGSSLAPEVITKTMDVELTVLDSTAPGQVLSALNDRLETSALVVSSKSGSTVETDSQRRAYEYAFTEAGIDPRERIIVVTDPGSPLDASAREAGYTVFNADPNVGGRYSALTAFGLVPSGLAGVNLNELLDEAESSWQLRSRARRRVATSSASSPTERTSSDSPIGPSSSSPNPRASRAPASCPSCSNPCRPRSRRATPTCRSFASSTTPTSTTC